MKRYGQRHAHGIQYPRLQCCCILIDLPSSLHVPLSRRHKVGLVANNILPGPGQQNNNNAISKWQKKSHNHLLATHGGAPDTCLLGSCTQEIAIPRRVHRSQSQKWNVWTRQYRGEIYTISGERLVTYGVRPVRLSFRYRCYILTHGVSVV